MDLGNGQTAMRIKAEPGWKWSECIKPAVGTDSCEKAHLGVCVSGKLIVTHDDGSSVEIGTWGRLCVCSRTRCYGSW